MSSNNEKQLEIRKVLVLSTGHLSQETFENYKDWPHIADIAGVGGYFFVGDEPEKPDTGAPQDLLNVLAFAKRHGCTEVKFDKDAERISQLPWFDW